MTHDLMMEAGLSLERLHTFCLIAEAGGITKAAGGDETRQPLFSRQLKELETYFATELVRRTGRGVTLTAEGKRLHQLVRNSLAALGDFKRDCAGQPSELNVGAGDSIIQWLLLPTLGKARKTLSFARLSFHNLRTQEIADRVAEGLMDLGVVRKDAVTARLKSVALGRLEYALYVPRRLLRSEKMPKWQEVLLCVPLALLAGEGQFRQELEKAAAAAGVDLTVAVECSSFPSVARALHGGGLAAILPTLAESEFSSSETVRVPLPWASKLARDMALVWSPRVAGIRTVIPRAVESLARLWRIG